MDLCFVFDTGYLEQFKVTAYSVIASNAKEDLNFHVLYTGIEREKLKETEEFIRNLGAKICFYLIDEGLFQRLPPMSGNSYATYYKLLIFQYLRHLPQVLYLDCDIIVKKPIGDLFLVEPEKGLVAVRDKYVNRKQADHVAEINGNPDGYFNAGVLLFRFDKLVEIPDLSDMLCYAAEHRDILMFHDQDVLNHFFSHNCGYAEEKYNYFTDYFHLYDFFFSNLRKASIVHYASNKPWKSDYTRKAYKLYRKNYLACSRLTPLHFLQKRKNFFVREGLLIRELFVRIRKKLRGKKNTKTN